VQTVAEIGRELGIVLPAPLRDALVAPEQCENLLDYISRIDLAIQVMQRPQDLARIARELIEYMAADGVIYAEVRFAPQLHTRRGMSLQEVVDVVSSGLRSAAAKHGIGVGLIICCLRHESAEQSLTIARLATANMDKVNGLDLAGDEGAFPDAEPHRQAFLAAREAGLHRTVHAGENAGPSSVRQALDRLGAERIGHGVRAEEDPALVSRVAETFVPLEMCPRSNVQTRATDSLAAHPIDRFLRCGVPVTVSTDCRTVSATTLTGEFELLKKQFGWGLREFTQCQEIAARSIFAPKRTKENLLERIGAALRDLRPEPA
jgi:adenosine deaminase